LTIAPDRAKFPAGHHLGEGTLYVDRLTVLSETFTPRARVYAAWLRTIRLTRPLLSLLVAVGALGWLVMLARAVRRRELAPALVVLSTLWLAILARVVLVALIEAGSFPALRMTYLAPAVPLGVLSGLVTVLAAVDAFGHRGRDVEGRT